MLTYKYTARNTKTGQKVAATVEADSEHSAAKLIRDQGYSPLEITLQKSEAETRGLKKLTHRIKTKDKVLFSRQLSTLINAGLPLLQSLRSVNEQTTNKSLKAVVDKVIADIEAGKSFSQALSDHPGVFNRVFIGLITAGEASGNLDKALERLSIQQEKDAEITAKIRGAMVYPVIVLVVMIAVVGFMLTTILPQVEELYKSLGGAQLPLVTRALLIVSHFILDFWYIILIVLIASIILSTRWVKRTPAGRQFFDKLKMRAPPMAQLFMKVYMARFSRTGASLVSSGVPLIQMLEITADSVGNVNIEESIEKAIEKVKGGTSLSAAIEGDPNFLSLVPNMLRIGEQSGAMEDMLAKTADYYEKEVDNQIKAISTIIEPVLMILLGIVAFVIVAAVLLPIYSLGGSIGTNLTK